VNAQVATSPTSGNRTSSWTQIAIICAIAAVVGWLVTGRMFDAPPASVATRNEHALLVVGLVLVLAVLSRWSHHAEHGLRGHTTVAQSYAATSGGWQSALPLGAGSAVFGRRYSPTSTGLSAVLFAAGAVLCCALAIAGHSQAVRSAFVQHHGTPAAATVTSVDNQQHCSRHSCSWTALISTTLSPPADGATTTVVHYPQYSMLGAGVRIAVLVDPKEPGYAELSGYPYKTKATWIIMLLAALVFAATAVFKGRSWLQLQQYQ
jgi:hypothetical protein